MKEDDLTKILIDKYKSEHPLEPDRELYPEAHYHHYGNRGSVDLYIFEEDTYTGITKGYVFEIKSESAVRNSTGANQIIRQFNRMREFFFHGSDHNVPNTVIFELCFLPSEYNSRHIRDYKSVYKAAVSQTHTRIREPDNNVHYVPDPPDVDLDPDFDTVSHEACITIRPPNRDYIQPGILFSDDDYIENPPTEYDNESEKYVEHNSYSEYINTINTHLYEEYNESIKILDDI